VFGFELEFGALLNLTVCYYICYNSNMKPTTEPVPFEANDGKESPEKGGNPAERLSSATSSLKEYVRRMAFIRPDHEGERVPGGFHPLEFTDGGYHVLIKPGTWYTEIHAWKGEQKGDPELIIGIANGDDHPDAPVKGDPHVRVVRGKNIWSSWELQKYSPPEQQALVTLLEKFDAILRRNDPPTAGQMRGVIRRKVDQLDF